MEFPPDKETMRSFLGMINYLNRYSALSAHLAASLSALTHQATDYKPGKVHLENFHRLNMEISNMKEPPYLNVNAETTLQMDASKKGPRASLIQNGKDIPVTDTFSQVTSMNPEDDIQLPIRKANMITTHILTHISTCILMSVQPQDSLSNKSDSGRVQRKAINSQDSAITSTQDSRVTRRVCQQIFTNVGTTGKHYPSNPGHLS